MLWGMDLQCSASLGKIAEALASAQAEIENADADSENPHFQSRYANLAAIIDAVRAPLAKYKIARHQAVISREDGTVGVSTTLIHSSGEYLTNTVWCKPDKPGPQALGSVITYLRRYSLAAAVGLAQDDDDAEGAEKRTPRGRVERPIGLTHTAPKLDSKVQARIKILQKENSIADDEWREKLQQYYKKSSSSELSATEAEDLIHRLEARKRSVDSGAHGATGTSKS